MKKISMNQTLSLLKLKATPSLSIYMNTEIDLNEHAPSVLKSRCSILIQEATLKLSKLVGPANSFLAMSKLSKELSNLTFSRRLGGIGIFYSQDVCCVTRIPSSTQDLVVVANSFHFKPILKSIQENPPYLLARVTNDIFEVILIDGEDREVILSHVRGRNSDSWFKEIAKTWSTHTKRFKTPMVLTTSHESLVEGVYESLSFQTLIDDFFVADVLRYDIDDLIDMTRPFIQSFERSTHREDCYSEFEMAKRSGRTTKDLEKITQAVSAGEIETLFIADEVQLWGKVDLSLGTCTFPVDTELHTHDDLLDDLAEACLLRRIKVVVLPIEDMPEQAIVAATLKWSMFGRRDSLIVPLNYWREKPTILAI